MESSRRKKNGEQTFESEIRERLTRVETIVKFGFPAIGAYITLLKILPSDPAKIPIKIGETAAAIPHFATSVSVAVISTIIGVIFAIRHG